jgi:hypothetical protein
MTDLSSAPIGQEGEHVEVDTPTAPYSYPVSVLTAPGGVFEVKEELRQVLALTADGKLHVSQQHRTDHYVMAFMDQLERQDHDFEVVQSTLSDIKALYQTSIQVASTPRWKLTARRRHSRCWGTPTAALLATSML